jgi:hypothetical protein
MSILTLLCYVRGDSVNKVFAVKIDNRQLVLELKDAIKEATKVTFRDINARSLVLWKLFLPVNQSLRVNVENLNPPNEDALLPNAILSEIFPDELDMRTIHILVAGEFQCSSSYMRLISSSIIACRPQSSLTLSHPCHTHSPLQRMTRP